MKDEKDKLEKWYSDQENCSGPHMDQCQHYGNIIIHDNRSRNDVKMASLIILNIITNKYENNYLFY